MLQALNILESYDLKAMGYNSLEYIITSYQMQSSFGAHESEPGRLQVTAKVDEAVRTSLSAMGYTVETVERTYSPITAIFFDEKTGTMWGGASDYGDDYGVAW